jgi:hypothetical protein
LCDGAVGRDEAGGDGDGQAFDVEAARGIVGFHLGLQCPTDVLQLWVADLKAVSDHDAARVEAVLFRDDIEQRWRQAKDEGGVVLVVDLPAGGCVCRNDVDVSVNGGAGVAFSSSATGDLRGGADVDGNEDTLQLWNF